MKQDNWMLYTDDIAAEPNMGEIELDAVGETKMAIWEETDERSSGRFPKAGSYSN